MKVFGIPVIVALVAAVVGYAVAKKTSIKLPLIG